MKISLSTPHFFGQEEKMLKKCISSKWISSSGPFTKNFENKIKKYLKVKNILGVINCTSALQLSIRLLNPKFNEEIIVPSITFVSPVNAVIYNNCKPIFMDCDKNFLIDIDKVINFLEEETILKKGKSYNKRTKKRILAIIIVHTFGNLVNLNDKFIKACKDRNIRIIEDAAESFGSYYSSNRQKKHAGTLGYLGCLSFNANKIITAGGGGMIIFSNKSLFNKALYLATQAKNNSTYFIHNEIGYNFRLSSLHAAIGLAQMSKIKEALKKKKLIHNLYKKEIDKVKGLKILDKPSYSTSNYWLNILMIDKKKYGLTKKKIIQNFKKIKIETRSIWYPNHLQKPFKNFQKYKINNSSKVYANSLCLPSSYNLDLKDQKKIIRLLKNKFK